MNNHKESTMNDNHTPDRAEAVASLIRLTTYDADDATTVGTFLAYLETLNDRLAQHAAAAGKVLEAGKRDLMRAGWVAAWMTINNDPDLIHDDPTSAFNAAFEAMKDDNR